MIAVTPLTVIAGLDPAREPNVFFFRIYLNGLRGRWGAVVFLFVFAERLSLLPLVLLRCDRYEFEGYLGNVGSNLLEKASFTEVGQFMQKLRKDTSVASRALEFLILTAARTNEVILEQWPEIDLAAKVWVVPAEHMKAKRKHRVPLGNKLCAAVSIPVTVFTDTSFDGNLIG